MSTMDTHDVHLSGEFSKFDEDKQVAFGWASIADIDGKPVVDRQDDVIKIDDLEEAAYKYVLSSRVGGEMHRREINLGQVDKANSKPRHVATLIESMVFTPEKIEKMGLPPGSVPNGWWIGFKVHDDGVWEKVKKGDYKAFSIHGKGRRVKKKLDELSKRDEQDVEVVRELIAKYGASKVAKHLIGSHNQKKHGKKTHDRAAHGSKDDKTRLSNRQRGVRAGLPVAAISATRGTPFFGRNKRGAIQRGGKGRDISNEEAMYRGQAGGVATGAVTGGLLLGPLGLGLGTVVGALGGERNSQVGSEEERDSNWRSIQRQRRQGVSKVDEPATLQDLIEKYGAEQVAKHLMGSHDQKSHARSEHGKTVDRTSPTERVAAGTAVGALAGAALGRNNKIKRKMSAKARQQHLDAAEGYAFRERMLRGKPSGTRQIFEPIEGFPRAKKAVIVQEGFKVDSKGVASPNYKPARVKKLLAEIFSPENVRKNENFTDTLRELADDITISKGDGSIGHEYDLPVDGEKYDALVREHLLEKRADTAYDGEWIEIEEVLKAFAEAIDAEDAEAVQALMEHVNQ